MSFVLPPDRGPARSALGFSAEWLAAQRWFRRKSRRVAEVAVHDAAPLGGDGWLLVLSATDEEGSEDRYLVPAVTDGGRYREPRDGEGVWRRLVVLMADGAELAAERGRFAFSAASALERLVPGRQAALLALEERRLGVEQSNTSVALGERLILKCYRLLEPGVNPEIEVTSFLTDVGFRGSPGLGGSAQYLPIGGEACAVAMLQQFVPSEHDAWRWVLDCLAGGPRARELAIEGLAQVGALTRDLHAALASRPEAPGFPSRTATAGELSIWHARAEGQLKAALASLSGEPRQRLLAVASHIRRRLAAINTVRDVHVSRIHGDYHLGQLLRTATGFTVIDFEGEPARPLAERREPASPLRDVAGMLRSIDYVAHVAQRDSALTEPDAWAGGARATFLSAYGGASATDASLLDAFEIEKACYEIGYEANNRPDWVGIPLGALERLAGRAR